MCVTSHLALHKVAEARPVSTRIYSNTAQLSCPDVHRCRGRDGVVNVCDHDPVFLMYQEGAKQSKEGRHPPLGVTKLKQQVKESKGRNGEEGQLNPGKSW